MSQETPKGIQIHRRGFLKGAAVLGAASAVLGGKPIIGALKRGTAEASPKVEEKWVHTSCISCPAVCPLQVKVQDGRAVSVEGNANSVVTDGAICAKAHLLLQTLYDPDRVKSPMKRTNPKKGSNEDPQWVPISWDEALTVMAEKMRGLRDKGEAHKVLTLRGRYAISDADMMYEYFGKAYGTPNNISHSALCAEGDKQAQWMANGQFKYSAYDLERCNYVLYFGLSPLEAHRPTARLQRQWGYTRQERGKRIKTVVIDPRLSATGTVADEWHPINPGTDGAMALAIAHEILVGGLWDKAFVGDFTEAGKRFVPGQLIDEKDFTEQMTFGLIKWWNLVLKDFTAEQAAKETGISSKDIARIAREFATTKPAIAWRSRGACAWTTGSYAGFAIFALNALVGSYDAPGGVLVQSGAPLKKLPAPPTDELGKKAAAMPRLDLKGTKKFPNASVITNQVADSVIKGDPYDVEMAIGWFCNWNHSAPGSTRWSDALTKIPFFVHITPFASEMTQFADIVLPTPTTLEDWAYETVPDAGGIAEVRIKQPVIKPLFDTRGVAQIAIDLAKKIGGHMAKAFETVPATNEAFVKQVASSVQPWSEFETKGVWSGPAYKYGDHAKRLLTPSKKFEFLSGNMKAKFEKLKMTDADLKAIHINATGEVALLPHYEAPRFLGDKQEIGRAHV